MASQNEVNHFEYFNYVSEQQTELPKFCVPFPPKITPEECIVLKDNKIPSKSPNCFIIYRRAFQKEIRENKCYFKLDYVSKLASETWKQEPHEVKTAYKEIAKQANYLLVNLRAKAAREKNNFEEKMEDNSEEMELNAYNERQIDDSFADEQSHNNEFDVELLDDTDNQRQPLLFDSNSNDDDQFDQEKLLREIKIPFPPTITPKEIIVKKGGKLPSKPPNSFIIYRRAFQKQCRECGYLLKLNVVSAMAAESWKEEPLEVKNAYKDLALQVNYVLVEMRAKEIQTRNHVQELKDLLKQNIDDSFDDIPELNTQFSIENHSSSNEENNCNLSLESNAQNMYNNQENSLINDNSNNDLNNDLNLYPNSNQNENVEMNLNAINNNYDHFEYFPLSLSHEVHLNEEGMLFDDYIAFNYFSYQENMGHFNETFISHLDDVATIQSQRNYLPSIF
ncbi:14572_t:CDS:2 [Ambispora leptoticha]|uniref:14572_t:CDS:1 n=1 Tax=Ambispora leptoticha TaxID=144679 RepID=A0A9N9FQM8_9GLOM|nr:14572_t:CDS:2 [Ambispora leptoticha]